MTRLLVTGSEGNLMQAVIPHLLSKGYEVRGVDSLFRHGPVRREREYEFIQGDLVDRELAEAACTGVDGVLQAAARIYGVRGFHQFPADILSCDTVLHANILWAALRKDVAKVAYISSSMVYERCSRIPSREEDVEDMPVPHTDYGLSKLVGERLCRAFGSQYGPQYAIWRPFNIVCPYEEGEAEPGFSHVFADFLKGIVVEQRDLLAIFGDGEQVRCFTWIDDVARAIADYSFQPVTDAQTFNLGNPEPVTMRELATRIWRLAQERGLIATGPLSFHSLPAYGDDVRVRIPSIDKARAVLGWEPRVKLDEALGRCLDKLAPLR